MTLHDELRMLEAGLAGYMMRLTPNDAGNDLLLARLTKCIAQAALFDAAADALAAVCDRDASSHEWKHTLKQCEDVHARIVAAKEGKT